MGVLLSCYIAWRGVGVHEAFKAQYMSSRMEEKNFISIFLSTDTDYLEIRSLLTTLYYRFKDVLQTEEKKTLCFASPVTLNVIDYCYKKSLMLCFVMLL